MSGNPRDISLRTEVKSDKINSASQSSSIMHHFRQRTFLLEKFCKLDMGKTRDKFGSHYLSGR